jgi:hypothetical protein
MEFEFCQSVGGLTVPPAPAFMVSKYCVLKLAVYEVLVAGVT